MSKAPIRFEEGKPILVAGLRRRHEYGEAERGIEEQWREFARSDVPGRIGTNVYGVMCGSDAAGLEYMCAVEVTTLEGLPDGIGRVRVPAQEYAVFLHAPGESGVAGAWQNILEWLATGDFHSAHKPDFEVYGSGVDPAAPAVDIEIWVGVVPRRSPTAR